MVLPSHDGRKEGFTMEKINATEKFCTKCGHKFAAVGREVICPACREAAKLEAKRAAVMRAKRASWNGESVPVRISGRASTIIRRYGAEKSLPFAAALDALLKDSDCFRGMQMAWEDITPYKSRRTKKSAQDVQDAPQDAPQEVKTPQEAKTTSKTTQVAKKATKTSKAANK